MRLVVRCQGDGVGQPGRQPGPLEDDRPRPPGQQIPLARDEAKDDDDDDDDDDDERKVLAPGEFGERARQRTSIFHTQ